MYCKYQSLVPTVQSPDTGIDEMIRFGIKSKKLRFRFVLHSAFTIFAGVKKSFTTTSRLLICLFVALMSVAQKSEAQEYRQVTSIVSDSDIRRLGVDRFFSSAVISDSVYAVMRGSSMPEGCPVGRSELRYLRVLHRNGSGESQVGELVCNKVIAVDLLYILRRLYDEGYPIERMTLIDNYGADDEASMTANNSSCFCYRSVRGTSKVSAHGRGLAIDINPLYNPCVRTRNGVTTVEPKAGRKYVKRHDAGSAARYVINERSIVYRLFRERGFTWGGNWKSLKDYQHFEKTR